MKFLLFFISGALLAQTARPVAPSRLAKGGATSGQCLAWLGQQWGPATCAANTGVSQSFTAQLSVSITHNFATRAVEVACFDASNKYFQPKEWTATTVNAVTVSFDSAKTGRCVVR